MGTELSSVHPLLSTTGAGAFTGGVVVAVLEPESDCFSFAFVLGPTIPVTGSPYLDWNFLTQTKVREPKNPVMFKSEHSIDFKTFCKLDTISPFFIAPESLSYSLIKEVSDAKKLGTPDDTGGFTFGGITGTTAGGTTGFTDGVGVTVLGVVGNLQVVGAETGASVTQS
jgi:hypothetical protein